MERPSPGRRKIWNITMFIISYALNNLVSGIIYDTYVNYMQEMARSRHPFGRFMGMRPLSVL